MINYTPQTQAELHLQWLCTQLMSLDLQDNGDTDVSTLEVINNMIKKYAEPCESTTLSAPTPTTGTTASE
jgi:hypothetical protein